MNNIKPNTKKIVIRTLQINAFKVTHETYREGIWNGVKSKEQSRVTAKLKKKVQN